MALLFPDLKGPNTLKSVNELLEACRLGDLSRVKTLVGAGVRVDVPGRKGLTPLTVACRGSRLEPAQFLIEQGADVNQKGMEGCSPLFDAMSLRDDFALLRLFTAGPRS